jgi:hypothetical protein
VHDVVAEVGQLLGELQLGLAAPQPLVGFLARGDVADEADEARWLGTAHPPDREVAGEGAAVPAPRLDLPSDADDPGLAGLHVPPHVAVVLALVGCRHQQAHVLANDLGGRVAEHALGGPAEFLDHAVVVDDDDGVDRGIEHRTELELGVRARVSGGPAAGGVCAIVGHRGRGGGAGPRNPK